MKYLLKIDQVRMPGTMDFYSNANLTDEIVEELIEKGIKKDLFIEIPGAVIPVEETISGKVQVFQIYYDEESKKRIHKDFTGYNNEGKETVFLESQVIVDVVEHAKSEFIGVVSNRFYEKLPETLTPRKIFTLIENSNAELFTFHKQPGSTDNLNVVKLAQRYHAHFIRLWELMYDRLGLTPKYEKNRAHIYSNHFIARIDIYKKFVDELLAPAIAVLSDPTDKEIQDLVWQDCGYKPNYPNWQENMKKKFGLNHYPYHPFLCERLISQWLDQNRDVRVEHLWK